MTKDVSVDVIIEVDDAVTAKNVERVVDAMLQDIVQADGYRRADVFVELNEDSEMDEELRAALESITDIDIVRAREVAEETTEEEQ